MELDGSPVKLKNFVESAIRELGMTRTLVVSIALLVAGLAAPVQADERLSRGEIVEIEDALDAWGCSGYDEIEKKTDR